MLQREFQNVAPPLTSAWQHSGICVPNKDQVVWNFAFPNVHLRQLFPNAAKRRTVMRNIKNRHQ